MEGSARGVAIGLHFPRQRPRSFRPDLATTSPRLPPAAGRRFELARPGSERLPAASGPKYADILRPADRSEQWLVSPIPRRIRGIDRAAPLVGIASRNLAEPGSSTPRGFGDRVRPSFKIAVRTPFTRSRRGPRRLARRAPGLSPAVPREEKRVLPRPTGRKRLRQNDDERDRSYARGGGREGRPFGRAFAPPRGHAASISRPSVIRPKGPDAGTARRARPEPP